LKFLVKFIFLLALLAFGNASAITLDFICATENNISNCAVGESKFSVDVVANATLGVDFIFNSNLGFENPTINEIYFESTLLNGIKISDIPTNSDVLLVEGSGVDFTLDKLSPGNLPGHKPIGFETSFGTQSLPGKGNAIGPTERLTVTILTLSLLDFTNALTDNFRIGLHAHSFNDGESESFVTSLSPVPVPAAIWLFGTALIGFIGFSRRTTI